MRRFAACWIIAMLAWTLVIVPVAAAAERPAADGELLQTWMRERDAAVQRLLVRWLMERTPMSDLKPLAQRIAEDELFILNRFGGDRACLERASLLYGRSFTPLTLPVALLEALYQSDLDIVPLFIGKTFHRA